MFMNYSQNESYTELGTACFRQLEQNQRPHNHNRSAIIDRSIFDGSKPDEMMPFELSSAATADLSNVNSKYNGLNENVRRFQQLKTSLKAKEQRLINMEKKLISRQIELQNVAEKWKNLCKEPAKYEAKKKEIEGFVEALKMKEKSHKAMKKELAKLKAKYKEKCDGLKEKEKEYKKEAEKWKSECTNKDKIYQAGLEKLRNKQEEFEKMKRTNEEQLRKIEERQTKLQENEKRIAEKKAELQKKAEEMTELGKAYKSSETAVIDNFNKMKAKHLTTLSKKKELLVKEQELKVTEIKLAQQKKELEAKASELETLEKSLSKLAPDLEKREKEVEEAEKEVDADIKNGLKESQTLKIKEEELMKREANLQNKSNLDEELEVKLLGIEMSSQALKRKQEISNRTLENEMQRLKIKEAELNKREQNLLLRKGKQNNENKENICSNNALEEALFS